MHHIPHCHIQNTILFYYEGTESCKGMRINDFVSNPMLLYMFNPNPPAPLSRKKGTAFGWQSPGVYPDDLIISSASPQFTNQGNDMPDPKRQNFFDGFCFYFCKNVFFFQKIIKTAAYVFMVCHAYPLLSAYCPGQSRR